MTPAGSPAKPAVGFGFAPLKDNGLLSAASTQVSDTTSRATSPGATNTDAESVNGAGEDGSGEHENHAQVDLDQVPANEEVQFQEYDVKALLNEEKGWASKGVGVVRLLRNKADGTCSVLMRMQPSGKVIFNARLHKKLTFKDSGMRRVTMPIISSTGKIQNWVLKFPTKDSSRLTSFVTKSKEMTDAMAG